MNKMMNLIKRKKFFRNDFFTGNIEEKKEFLKIISDMINSKEIRDKKNSYVENKTKINYLLETFESNQKKNESLVGFFKRFCSIYEDVGLNFNPRRNLAHMLSEPSKVGLMGHLLGVIFGGNQVAQEVSPIENSIEIKTGKIIQELLGYKEGTQEFHEAISFITAGGTDANILALFVGRNVSYLEKEKIHLKNRGFSGLITLNPNGTQDLSKLRTPKLIVPQSAHYSFDKISNLLGIGEENLIKVPSDENFRIDTIKLERTLHQLDLKKEKPIAVVLVLGSTEIGAVDNISEAYTIINNFSDQHNERIWIHLDGAFGLPAVLTKKYAHLRNILPLFDSVTFDPHKLLWTPYNAGSITFKKKSDLQTISTDASYINNKLSNLQEFKKKLEEHLGGIKLIGSQSTSGILSTYLTLKYLGFEKISQKLEHLFEITQYLSKKLQNCKLSKGKIEVLNQIPDLNLVVFRFLPEEFIHYDKNSFLDHTIDQTAIKKIEEVNQNIFKIFLNKDTKEIISCVKLASTGIYALRVCIMNPLSKKEDIDHLVESVRLIIEKKIIVR